MPENRQESSPQNPQGFGLLFFMCDGPYLRQEGYRDDMTFLHYPEFSRACRSSMVLPRRVRGSPLFLPHDWTCSSVLGLVKDNQRCCRNSHSAVLLANNVVRCPQGCSGFLWTVGGAHLPSSLKVRVRHESHRLFLASRKIIQKEFHFFPNRRSTWTGNRPFVSNTLN